MNEKPLEKQDAESPADDSVWARDQEKHSYYYDDDHGYEVYNPEEDEDADEDADEKDAD